MTDQAKKIGLYSAVGFVFATMIGSGIVMLPSVLATIGAITIISLLITIIGVIFLGYIYSKLTTQSMSSHGSNEHIKEISNMLGYQTSIIRYVASWLGNLAILIACLAYASYFFPLLINKIPLIILGIFIIIFVTVFNLWNFQWITKLAFICMCLMLVPVVLTSIFGWFYFSLEQYMANWQVSSSAFSISNIISGIILCLWCFLGFESSTYIQNKIRLPDNTIPKTIFIGIGIASFLYIISTQVIFGMYPNSHIATSYAPFAMTSQDIFGASMSYFSIFFTILSCLTCLILWMRLIGHMGKVSAEIGDFPESWKFINQRGAPTRVLWITCLEMCIAWIIFISLSTTDLIGLFITIISISTTLSLIPMFYSSANLLRIAESRKLGFISFFMASLGIAFCFIAILSGGMAVVSTTFIIILVTIAFYASKKGRFTYNEKHKDFNEKDEK